MLKIKMRRKYFVILKMLKREMRSKCNQDASVMSKHFYLLIDMIYIVKC